MVVAVFTMELARYQYRQTKGSKLHASNKCYSKITTSLHKQMSL